MTTKLIVFTEVCWGEVS